MIQERACQRVAEGHKSCPCANFRCELFIYLDRGWRPPLPQVQIPMLTFREQS